MKLTSRATILVVLTTVAVLVPAVAFGAFSTGTSNPGNAVAAGVLKAPGTLTATAHVPDNATNQGDVTLTWNDGLSNTGTVSPAGYLIERQAAGSTEWQAAATPAYAGVCDNESHECAFTDATAAFNTTYSYRVRSTVSDWTAGPSTVRLAASIAPTAAEERTAATTLNSVARSSSGLIAVGQGGRIMVCADPCTGTASWQAATSPTSNDLYRVVFDAGVTGRAWAAGAGGTLLTCASNCATTSATWTSVNAGTSDSLYGIATSTGYVAVVGANRTMRFSTDAPFGSWQSGTVNAGTATTTLYGIAAKNSKNVVIVGGTGTSGVIAACSFTGSGVCGSTALGPVTYAGSAPAADMRDVAFVSGGGDNVYAVGMGGNVYVSASLTGSQSAYTRKNTGSSADLYAVAAVSQNLAGAVGEPTSPASSIFLRCTTNCAGSGAWSAGPNTGTTNRLSGITGSGGSYWAVGAGGTIRFFNGSTWVTQSSTATATVSPAQLQANDGNRFALATATSLGTACTAPALVATATVPARSSSAITSPAVKVTIGYDFTGGTNTSRVSLSTNGGSTWSGVALTSNVTAATVKTVDFTGNVPAGDSPQQIQLCVQGAGGNGRMNVDMIHIDVDE